MAKKLIPPDREQCQAEKPNGATFMTFGGRPQLVRCQNKPIVIAREKKPDTDGLRGSMSLCPDCMEVMIKQLGDNYATFRPIVRKQHARGT